ncbi:peptidoglycan bridge formation glycyltransferase FemA/FemB family protein [Candidatus Saccharibacteria bacterium]|nr:peptidoglycan bridge formation glycyltransferase FemA/FemB family protein [Candidatus Saccharibacteria bacterium]
MVESWTKIFQTFPEANFLQSPLWAETNRLTGCKLIMRTFEDKAMYLGIIKDARRGRYLEIPGGPLVDWQNRKLVKAVFESIIEEAKKEKCVFVRFRPQLFKTPDNVQLVNNLKTEIKGLDLRTAPMHLHAQNTILLDLSKSEEDLLMSMRRQTRYEVRRSEKLGLKVIEDSSEKAFEEFHAVQSETAKRQNFVPPSEKELLAERKAFLPENLKLYKVVDSEEHPVAYGLVLIYGREAEYFEAASTELNRKLPGAYALLWRAIKDLKAMNIERFNLWGIAPPGVEHHRYSGVTTFKTGFGGEIIEFIPAQDIVINKLKYKLDEIVETARKKKRNL